jgi:hypothetical protein
MSSITIRVRIKRSDPLFVWITQLEDAGENVSEAVRSSLRCQLSQDVTSTYYPLYKVHMQNSARWCAANEVLSQTHKELMREKVRDKLGF